ncbi:unnamed protein product [Amoebophrya sp. A120]|nr:unnamed protein product [Amoebophrya sp. A120]|eukprot:GSA120T00010528001.1
MDDDHQHDPAAATTTPPIGKRPFPGDHPVDVIFPPFGDGGSPHSKHWMNLLHYIYNGRNFISPDYDPEQERLKFYENCAWGSGFALLVLGFWVVAEIGSRILYPQGGLHGTDVGRTSNLENNSTRAIERTGDSAINQNHSDKMNSRKPGLHKPPKLVKKKPRPATSTLEHEEDLQRVEQISLLPPADEQVQPAAAPVVTSSSPPAGEPSPGENLEPLAPDAADTGPGRAMEGLGHSAQERLQPNAKTSDAVLENGASTGQELLQHRAQMEQPAPGVLGNDCAATPPGAAAPVQDSAPAAQDVKIFHETKRDRNEVVQKRLNKSSRPGLLEPVFLNVEYNAAAANKGRGGAWMKKKAAAGSPPDAANKNLAEQDFCCAGGTTAGVEVDHHLANKPGGTIPNPVRHAQPGPAGGAGTVRGRGPAGGAGTVNRPPPVPPHTGGGSRAQQPVPAQPSRTPAHQQGAGNPQGQLQGQRQQHVQQQLLPGQRVHLHDPGAAPGPAHVGNKTNAAPQPAGAPAAGPRIETRQERGDFQHRNLFASPPPRTNLNTNNGPGPPPPGRTVQVPLQQRQPQPGAQHHQHQLQHPWMANNLNRDSSQRGPHPQHGGDPASLQLPGTPVTQATSTAPTPVVHPPAKEPSITPAPPKIAGPGVKTKTIIVNNDDNDRRRARDLVKNNPMISSATPPSIATSSASSGTGSSVPTSGETETPLCCPAGTLHQGRPTPVAYRGHPGGPTPTPTANYPPSQQHGAVIRQQYQQRGPPPALYDDHRPRTRSGPASDAAILHQQQMLAQQQLEHQRAQLQQRQQLERQRQMQIIRQREQAEFLRRQEEMRTLEQRRRTEPRGNQGEADMQQRRTP